MLAVVVIVTTLAVGPPRSEQTQTDDRDAVSNRDQHPNDHSEAGPEVHVLEARVGEAEL